MFLLYDIVFVAVDNWLNERGILSFLSATIMIVLFPWWSCCLGCGNYHQSVQFHYPQSWNWKMLIV